MKKTCSSSKLPFPPASRRKNVRLFCSACRRKNLCVFALPVEEKACDFSLCLSRKRAARAHGSLFPLPVEEKAIMGTWRALAIYFSPCLSKKSLSQDSPPPGSPRPALLGGLWTTAFAPSGRQGKGKLRTAFASSRWPFPFTCRGKCNIRAPPA